MLRVLVCFKRKNERGEGMLDDGAGMVKKGEMYVIDGSKLLI